MKVIYPAKIAKDTNGKYFVKFSDIPGAITEGETLDEAIFNASEAITGVLEVMIEEGVDVPIPSKVKKGEHLIAPEARVQSALLLHWGRGDRTIAEIARSVNTSWAAIQKLEKPGHTPSLSQLEKVAHALGKQLVIEMI